MARGAKKENETPSGVGPNSRVVQTTIASIEKLTKQKPMDASYTTLPHVPSGSAVVDVMIGGGPAKDGKGMICPGFPKKKYVEVFGAESSGKTTLALTACAEVQRAGGTVLYLDYEHALDHGYAKALGVQVAPPYMLLYQPATFEEGLQMIYLSLRTGIDLIVVDSVAAMVPKAELERGIQEEARVGLLAAKLSQNLPKLVQWLNDPKNEGDGTAIIFLNQTRALIQKGPMTGGDSTNSSGGKAVKFYASARLQLTRIRSEYIEKMDELTLKKRKIPFGNVVKVKNVKNKVDARQGMEGEIFIRYGFGIDDYLTLIEAATARKIVKKEGTWLVYGDQRFQGREKFRRWLMEKGNEKALATLRATVQEAVLKSAVEGIAPEADIDENDIVSDARAAMGDDDLMSDTDDTTEEATIEAEE